jgi:N-acetyl-gamma-glutamyl-phosphate reductase
MHQIFIDGSAGTTGLRIRERLMQRDDISLIQLDEAMRKDPSARKEALNRADVVFLCLPDDASREAVSMIENPDTVVLDTSTAHRMHPGWTYGFPELSAAYAANINSSKRIAVPGCHASGFIALAQPLVAAGFLSEDAHLSCHSLTGYSGGGKKMIAEYESDKKSHLFEEPRQYGLNQNHKHIPEMMAISGLAVAPLFCPIVSDFYSGMLVTVPLFASDLKKGNADAIKEIYRAQYQGPIVKYTDAPDPDGMISAAGLSGKDAMEISVFGNEERILLTARYDNLGKGASGAAIELMNMVLGSEITTGLVL